jgi:hypothetical protein
MPTFENGWICRECWSANREQDQRCYRCHAVPKRREMPEPATYSTPDGRPNEERKKVSSLTGPSASAAVQATPPAPSAPPTPVAPPAPRTPLADRIRGLAIVVWVRAVIAAFTGVFRALLAFGRAVAHAPGDGMRALSRAVGTARSTASAGARSAASHRRVWLSVAWMISAVSSALLFSVALKAPLAASLLVVASVAIFSSLSAAITTGGSERQGQRAAATRHEHVAASPEPTTQPAEILGSRAVR